MPRPVTSAAERFWPKVNKSGIVPQHRPDLGPCWEWLASTNNRGYGTFASRARYATVAHRWAYEHMRGPIPPGACLDHLCRNRLCVNPDHLEPVTTRENLHRGEGFIGRQARQTHCSRGHEFTSANTYVDKRGYRSCRECRRAHHRRWYRRHRQG